jgi:hypothetical protein
MTDTKLTLTPNTLERFYEIAFVQILDNMVKVVANEKLDYFLEHLCKVLDIDYTSMSILRNMYYPKMKPTKIEIAMFSKLTDVPMARLPIDYRTYRKYARRWEATKLAELNPYIVNAFLKPVVKKFVDDYINLMFDDLFFIKAIKGVKPIEKV